MIKVGGIGTLSCGRTRTFDIKSGLVKSLVTDPESISYWFNTTGKARKMKCLVGNADNESKRSNLVLLRLFDSPNRQPNESHYWKLNTLAWISRTI